MKFLRQLLVLSVCIAVTSSVQAQIEQLIRKDIEIKDDGVGHTLPIGAKGVLIHGPVKSDGEEDWRIRHLDVNLEEISSVSFVVPNKYKSIGHIRQGDNSRVYFLFMNTKSAYEVKIYDTEKRTLRTVSGTFPVKFKPSELKILNASLFLSGTAKKNEVLFRIDTRTGANKLVMLPGLGKELTILDVSPYEEKGQLAVSVRHGRSRKVIENTFEVCFYDEGGEKSRAPFRIQNEPMRTTLNAKVNWLGADHFLFSGSYSSDKNLASNGLYMAEFKEGEQVFIQYHNFQNMGNFLSYLPEKQKERAEKRVDKKKAKGKENAVAITVVTHPIFHHNDQYVLVAEAYFPTYTTYTTTTFINGQPTTQIHHVFNGYQYTHAVVLGLDRRGNKLWDHAFGMYLEQKPFSVRLNIVGVQTEEDIRLLYGNKATLKSLRIKNDNTVVEQDLGAVTLASENQELKKAGWVNTQFWYDTYFLVYGQQRIKGSEDGKSDKRSTVYFVSKVLVNAQDPPEKGMQLRDED